MFQLVKLGWTAVLGCLIELQREKRPIEIEELDRREVQVAQRMSAKNP